MKERAAIIGPYRLHNFGDDLIGAIIASDLKEKGYQPTVVGLARKNADWLGIDYAKYGLNIIDQSSLVVIGGGGIFGVSGPRKSEKYRIIAAKVAMISKLKRKRVIITGIGAGPLYALKSKLLVRIASLFVDAVGVRDDESASFLHSISVAPKKITVGADLAILLNKKLSFPRKEPDAIGIQFDINGFLPNDPGLLASSAIKIKQTLQNEVQTNLQNCYLITNGSYRSQLLERNCCNERDINYVFLPEFLSKLSCCKAVLTSHLHIAIASFALRIPCFSFYVREKTARFFRQIGRPERAIDLKYAKEDDLMRVLSDMHEANWTEFDEKKLLELEKQAEKLLSILPEVY